MEIKFMCCVSDSSHFFKVLPRDQKPLVILILLLRILDLLVRDPISSTCILESRIEPESLIQTVSYDNEHMFSVNFLCVNHLFFFICREAKSSLIYVAGYSY